MTTISSSGSVQQLGTLPEYAWWIRDLDDEMLDLEVDVDTVPLELKSHEEQAVFEPLGRTHPVVVTDMVRAERFDISFFFATKAEYNAFLNLRSKQKVLLLQSPYGDQWYFRFGANRKTKLQNTSPASYNVEIEIIEVDNPDSLIGLV